MVRWQSCLFVVAQTLRLNSFSFSSTSVLHMQRVPLLYCCCYVI
jgi:hypothetical protein